MYVTYRINRTSVNSKKVAKFFVRVGYVGW